MPFAPTTDGLALKVLPWVPERFAIEAENTGASTTEIVNGELRPPRPNRSVTMRLIASLTSACGGMPEITPLEVFNVAQDGSVPESTAQVRGANALATDGAAENACPVVAMREAMDTDGLLSDGAIEKLK